MENYDKQNGQDDFRRQNKSPSQKFTYHHGE